VDFSGFLSSFLADAFAGLVVVGLGYWFVDKKLHLRDRRDRQDEAEAERAANRTHVLKAVVGELHSNMAQLDRVVRALKNRDGVPFPLFDVSMWTVLSQAPVFTTLHRRTVTAAIHAYNRMVTANDQCKFLGDMTYGSTALLATSFFAGRMGDAQVREVHDQFRQSLDDTNSALLARLTDLKPHLEAAIDAVEAEIGVEAAPASQRVFVAEGDDAELHVVGKPRDQGLERRA
jgi:hypothetical protein